MGNIPTSLGAVSAFSILLLEDCDEDAVLVERALSGTGYAYSLRSCEPPRFHSRGRFLSR